MLKAYVDTTSGLSWDTFYEYNDQGQVVLDAAPAAVSGYNDSYADLLHYQSQSGTYQYLNNSSGLIQLFDYYTTTTAAETTAGGVTNYVEDSQLEQGQNGVPIKQEAWQYFAHAPQAGAPAVNPVATDTVYSKTDGTGAETTSYTYSWYTGTAQIQSKTTTKPLISAAENGPGTFDVETTFADAYGRVVWSMDGDGYLSYTAYDPATGAVVETIKDVNTNITGDFTGKPTGWTTPSGGGLNLVTQYQVDALGRTTAETDPNGNVTYTVYDDPDHEVRVYRGWNSTTHLPTGPTEVYREDRAGGYYETLTMSATPNLTGGLPNGTENISNIQTLSREYTNAAGQVVSHDDYFNLSGVTYSTALNLGTQNVNYYRTQYGYDDRGRKDRIVTPNGTIYRTVYDGLGRKVGTYVGTNDTAMTQVALGGSFNRTGITADGTAFSGGGLDNGGSSGHALSASQLGSSLTWNGGNYAFGAAGSNDAVSAAGQTLTLPAGQYTALSFLGTAVNGNQANQTFTVTYTDGSTQTFTQSLSDWLAPQSYAGESTALAMSYRNNANGTRDTRSVYLYGYSFALNPTKTVQSITLPNNGNVVILALDLTFADWTPTDNTAGPANMVQTAAYFYDQPNNTLDAAGGVGDGDLTEVKQFPGGGAAARVTQDWYDWRDRLVATKEGVQATEDTTTHRPIYVTAYDNLNEATQVQQYDGDGVAVSVGSNGVPVLSKTGHTQADLLRAQTDYAYDDQGRVYQTQTFGVNSSTGAVSTNALTTNDYYDHRGDLIAESMPGGQWTKMQYDGAGREVMSYTTDGGGGATWAAASTVANDVVLEQTQTVYDADGNTIEQIDRQRFHNATGTGALGTPTSGVLARVSYAAYYYDAADRLTAAVDVGTNGGTAWARPASAPSASDTVLVTSYAYNAAGWLQDVIDPKGIDTRTYYDAMGRTTETVDNYTGNAETASSDVATEYTYDGDNHVLTVKADEPNGAYETTQYVYGVSTSTISSNDLLATVEHPDPTTGNPSTSASQEESYTYNALGQALTYTDRNGTTHTYAYDVLGRQTSDTVTTLGANVDGSVRRIETAYDTQGNAYLVTSYDAVTGGNIVSQVLRQYNGLGQLTAEYQSHSGAVNTSTTPGVHYAYTEMAGGVNNSRLTSITYPNGRQITYNYASGLDDRISRVTSLSDSSGTLEAYLYLGLGTIVERDHPQNSVNLTYISQSGQTGDAGDQYVGLDRFGRVVDQNWYNTSTGQSTDEVQYGYDRDSNVLWRNEVTDAVFSELYQYDNLNQLTGYQRGTLNATKTGIVGTPTQSQSWTLDAEGNWSSVTTNSSTQTRGANQQNEITSISGSGTVSYDNNGNLTADGSGNTYVYDAWNRLVAVRNGGTTIASYGYDGMGRRITETESGTTRDLYYSAAWQVLEERVNGQVQAQNVWGIAYVDELVLRDQSSQGNGVLDQRLYVQQDANWNVTALVNTSGAVVERYAYLPYGAVMVLAPDFSSRGASSYGWRYLFQGGRLDPATGLYNFRHRDYSPSLGRWLQADPLGLRAGDTNLYRTEGDNSIDWLDPTGLGSWGGAAVGGAGGALAFGFAAWALGSNPLGWAILGGLVGAALFGPPSVKAVVSAVGRTYVAAASFTLAVATAVPCPPLALAALAFGADQANTARRELETLQPQRSGFNQFISGLEQWAGVPEGAANRDADLLELLTSLGVAWKASAPEAPQGPQLLKPVSGTAPATTTPANSPLLRRYLSESGGRWGGTATRQLNHRLATDLETRGFRVTGGAGRAAEEWIPGPGGGARGGSWVDITATNGTQTTRIQTVTTLADGVTPTASEAAAAARIRAAFPNDTLILVSKQTGLVIP
jgi:RHS repeat-associated protein